MKKQSDQQHASQTPYHLDEMTRRDDSVPENDAGKWSSWLPQSGDPWNDALLEIRIRRRVGEAATDAARDEARRQILAEEADIASRLASQLRELREQARGRSLKLG